MSQSAVLANLQSALDCVGKCDCCDGLQSQINDLRSQISTKIGQEEKPAIVAASVASVEQLIVPGILFFVGNAVNGLRPEIAAAAAAASRAAATATSAATAAAGAVAQLAGMAAQIVSILASIATLVVLGERIDAVESLALSIGNGLSEALSLIGTVKSMATEAQRLANQALAEVGDLRRYVGELSSTILSQVDARINALRMELEGIINARVSELKNLIKDIVATLSEIIARVGNIEIQLQSFKESIAVLQSQVNSIFGRVGVLEGETAIIEQKVGVLEGAIGEIRSDIAGLWTSIFALPTTISTLVQEGIQTFVPPAIQTLVPPAIQTLVPPAIQTLVPPMIAASVPGIIGDVSLVTNNWISINVPPLVTNLVNNMPAVDLSPVLQAIATVDVKVDGLLGNISGQLAPISAGVIANGEQIKKVPVEVIDDNRKLALDTPNKLKSALCEELQNGECFPSAMNRWIDKQPLAQVPNQIGNLTPIIVNTGNIVTNQNSTITNLGNQISNQNNAITNVNNAVNNQNSTITNLGNQISNQGNVVNNVNNAVNNQTTAITNVNNAVNNQNTAITNVNNAVNNQTTAITNVNNAVNNQNTAITNVNNTVNNIDTNIQEIADILDEPCDPCQTLGWIEVSVPTVNCTLISEAWVPVINMINVKVLATEEGNEAAQIVNSYQEIAKANTALCLANNKEEEKECYAAIPDMWLIRPEHHRPQLIFQFGEVVEGRVGSPKYPITIPHPKVGFRPSENTLPQYRKGNWEKIYVLKDNSKIVLHTFDEFIGAQLLEACITIVDPSYLEGSYLSKNGEVKAKTPLAEIEVAPKMAKFFSEGRKNSKPDWLVRF